MIGYEDDFAYLGGISAIVAPDGLVEASAGPRGDAVIVATVDTDRLADARRRLARGTTPAAELYRNLYQS